MASTTGAQGRRRRLRRFNHGGVQKFSAFVVGDIWKTVAREAEDGEDHGERTRRIRRFTQRLRASDSERVSEPARHHGPSKLSVGGEEM